MMRKTGVGQKEAAGGVCHHGYLSTLYCLLKTSSTRKIQYIYRTLAPNTHHLVRWVCFPPYSVKS